MRPSLSHNPRVSVDEAFRDCRPSHESTAALFVPIREAEVASRVEEIQPTSETFLYHETERAAAEKIRHESPAMVRLICSDEQELMHPDGIRRP